VLAQTSTPEAPPAPGGSDSSASPGPPGRESGDRADSERRYRDDRRGEREDRGWRWRGRDDADDYARDEERGRRWRRDRDDDRYSRRWDYERRGDWRDRDRRGDGPRGFGMGGDHHGGMMGQRRMSRFCGPAGERMVGFMLDRLERITQPTDAQKAAFDKVKEAASKARETMQASCPSGPPPITMTGRLAAAEKRLEAMLAAVRLVRQPLDEYYATLSEEQKARLYMAHPRGGRDRFDRMPRERGGDRLGPDDGRRAPRDGERERLREDRREGLNYRDRDSNPEFGASGDVDGDGWIDDWRGRS
jgi:hypothetical protein